jgi:hypothetical protein
MKIRHLRALLIGSVLIAVAPAAAAEPLAIDNETPWPLVLTAGEIQALDLANHTLIANGLRYTVALDVQVQIGGGAGAFTLLEPGMQIAFEYLRISDEERRVVRIRQMPPGVQADGV